MHATLAHAVVHGQRRLGRGISDATAAEYWRDWLRLGRLIGGREQDLPARWEEFDSYFEETVRTELTANPTVELVLDTLRRPARPSKLIPRPLWRLARWPAGAGLQLMTLGLMSPLLRRRLGLPLSRQEATFELLAATSRAADPLMVGPLRVGGPYYVHQRRAALERGDVARPRDYAEAA